MSFHDNLPPGCSVEDLPGNSRQDVAWDALVDRVVGDLENLIQEAAEEQDICPADFRVAVLDSIS